MRQAEALVKAQQDIGETMGKLGLAFIQLTKLETDMAVYDSQKIRAAGFRQVATAAVKASRFYRELNAQSVKHLVCKLFLLLVIRSWLFLSKSSIFYFLNYFLGNIHNAGQTS